MAQNALHNTPAPRALLAPVGGVLFDIDDTLVELHQAMKDAMIEASLPLVAGFGAEDWDAFAAVYMADAQDYYDRFVAGEFTFTEQRGLRARATFEHFGIAGFDARAEQAWIADFERAQPAYIRAYSDVLPVLDALDAAGIPYGCVSNNVHDYQRAKLDTAGLERIKVLVGIDAVKAAKPDPRVFHEGCRRLGLAPEAVLYVGDNYALDGLGSAQAGLQGVWLNRKGAPAPSNLAGSGVHQVATLAGVGRLLGLNSPVPSV